MKLLIVASLLLAQVPSGGEVLVQTTPTRLTHPGGAATVVLGGFTP